MDPALVGAAIGAGGAVAAQIIGSIFTQRSERKRFDWERDQAIRREKLERSQQFIDYKRDVFVRFLAENNRYLRRTWDQPDTINTASFFQFQMDVGLQLSQEIALIAPELTEACDDVFEKAYALSVLYEEHDATSAPDITAPQHVAYNRSIRDCRIAMARYLAAED